jgi:hypothetical protein
MEDKIDNLLCSKGFIPNDRIKFSKYLNLKGNPFTKLANIDTFSCLIAPSTTSQLLYHKMINCNKHHIHALMLNADITNNHWRLLEILYYYLFKIYGKHLLLWNSVVTELKDSFDKEIENISLGRTKVAIITYSVLVNIITYIKYDTEIQFVLLHENDISWKNIYDIFLDIIKLFPEKKCTCNDYIEYPISFLKEISKSYNNNNKNNLENILNNVPIDYTDIYFKTQYITDIYKALKPKIPKPKVVGNVKLPYDFLPESYRLHFIHRVIKNSLIINKLYNIDDEILKVFRISNKCFVCDGDVTEILYNTHIKNDEICESISKEKSDTIYPIIHRCLICRNESKNKLLKSNNDCIMARHYKWMVFYLGHQTISLYLPKEILWLIIIKYLNIRSI